MRFVSDIFWDRVVSVEPLGVRDTYDLTVDVDHNFVADGLIVHNSHTAAYAQIGYQTAYLKRHFTAEFMAALLSSEIDDGNKRDVMVDHIADARKMGVQVLPPDVNRGRADFDVQNGMIVFGLTAIKGVGRGAAEALAVARDQGGPFRDLFDFCERVDLKSVPKAAVERLVKAGAMDSFATPFAHRAQLLEALPMAIAAASETQEDRKRGQRSIFDLAEPEIDAPTEKPVPILPNVPRWSNTDQPKFEKEALDFYFSSHPLAEFDADLRRYASHSVEQALKAKDGGEVRLGGMIIQTRLMTTKRGGRYARCKVEDFTGQAECVMWPEEFAPVAAEFADDKVFLFEATVEQGDRSEPIFLLKKLMTVEQARRDLTKGMVVNLQLDHHPPELIDRIAGVLKRTPGPCTVYMQVRDAFGRKAQFRLGDEFRVHPGDVDVSSLETMIGQKGAVVFTGRG